MKLFGCNLEDELKEAESITLNRDEAVDLDENKSDSVNGVENLGVVSSLEWSDNSKVGYANEITKSLQNDGLMRLPRPSEAYDILIAHHNGVLPERYMRVKDNLLDTSQMFNYAASIENNSLRVYTDVRRLEWEGILGFGKKYVPRIIPGWHDTMYEFGLGGLQSGKNDLSKVAESHGGLIKMIYGVGFSDIPEQYREAATVCLPSDAKYHMISKCGDNPYSICLNIDKGVGMVVSMPRSPKNRFF